MRFKFSFVFAVVFYFILFFILGYEDSTPDRFCDGDVCTVEPVKKSNVAATNTANTVIAAEPAPESEDAFVHIGESDEGEQEEGEFEVQHTEIEVEIEEETNISNEQK
jgi:hypothetical protein